MSAAPQPGVMDHVHRGGPRLRTVRRLGGAVFVGGLGGGCPMCGRLDAVRPLHALYHDRRQSHAWQPPLVSRYGLVNRAAAFQQSGRRYTGRIRPPRQPSLVSAYVGLDLAPALALVALTAWLAAHVVQAGTIAMAAASLFVAFLAGLLGPTLRERGQQRWNARLARWQASMAEWRSLRYCRRCNQVFV